jgi:hypothetical protein
VTTDSTTPGDAPQAGGADAPRRTRPVTPHEAARAGVWRVQFKHYWLLLPLLAVAELVSLGVTMARVPPLDDWRAAADFVRSAEQPGDLVVSAPAWTDPLLRLVLGDRLTLAQAGRSDTDAFTRLWALSTRGEDPREAPAKAPAFTRLFGRVRVLRWDLGASPVQYDLVAHVREAEVTRVEGDAALPCPWRVGTAQAGGLGGGAATPAERFDCDARRPWLWVAATVQEDLELEARHCVYQHPQGREPIRTTFRDVPLGTRLVLYGGPYAEHERMGEHGPIDVVVKVAGRIAGRMTHRDLDGWKRMEVTTAAQPGTRGDVAIEVSAENPHLRTFCWAAQTQAGPRRPRSGE